MIIYRNSNDFDFRRKNIYNWLETGFLTENQSLSYAFHMRLIKKYHIKYIDVNDGFCNVRLRKEYCKNGKL